VSYPKGFTHCTWAILSTPINKTAAQRENHIIIMAFRKRVYAGSRSGPRKRARYMKRRTYRRRTRGRASYAVSSQRGNTSRMGFRGRKMPYRKYLNNMYNASTFKEHHRSINITALGAFSNVSNTASDIFITPLINDSFWSTSGGVIGGTNVVPDEDIFIRGGISSITYRNNGTAPVTIKTYIIYRHSAEGFTISTPQSAMWDPTSFTNFERFYNIKRTFTHLIEPGDQNTITQYLGKRKVEVRDFNDGYRREYWISTINSTVGAVESVTILYGHNLSFVTDRL